MTAQKCIKCVYIHRMQLKKLRAIIYFSRLNCSHCWNQSAVTCSTFMQQNWQHARFRVPITFPCMFVNFHSEKLRFPMSKCLPLAKDFSGGEMVSDKISWKNPKQSSCDPVTPTSTFYLQGRFICRVVSVRCLHFVGHDKDKNYLLLFSTNYHQAGNSYSSADAQKHFSQTN